MEFSSAFDQYQQPERREVAPDAAFAPVAPSPAQANAPRRHAMRFTGAGSEYFRVWIVNILLTIVTIGWYTPWARFRTANYFYGHSFVGDSPLQFTGNISRMLKGFAVLFVYMAAYQLSGRFQWVLLNGVLSLVGLVLMPFVWWSAMRFRLHNTRWRGMRLQFDARLRSVVFAMWPFLVCILLFAGLGIAMAVMVPAWVAGGGWASTPPGWYVLLFVVGMIAFTVLGTLMMARVDFNLRSLLATQTRIGDQNCHWDVGFGKFSALWFRTLGVYWGSATAAGLLGVLMGVFLGADKGNSIAVLVPFLMFLIAMTITGSYYQARVYHIVWNRLRIGQIAAFSCNLSCGAFVWLRVKNMVLTVITLGMYRPFARVHEYRMKLESVTLHVKGDLDQLSGSLQQNEQSGVGDAIADAFGIDLIS